MSSSTSTLEKPRPELPSSLCSPQRKTRADNAGREMQWDIELWNLHIGSRGKSKRNGWKDGERTIRQKKMPITESGGWEGAQGWGEGAENWRWVQGSLKADGCALGYRMGNSSGGSTDIREAEVLILPWTRSGWAYLVGLSTQRGTEGTRHSRAWGESPRLWGPELALTRRNDWTWELERKLVYCQPH